MGPGTFKFLFLALMGSGIPVAIAMAGGYARDIEDSIEIHANTIRTARRLGS